MRRIPGAGLQQSHSRVPKRLLMSPSLVSPALPDVRVFLSEYCTVLYCRCVLGTNWYDVKQIEMRVVKDDEKYLREDSRVLRCNTSSG